MIFLLGWMVFVIGVVWGIGVVMVCVFVDDGWLVFVFDRVCDEKVLFYLFGFE